MPHTLFIRAIRAAVTEKTHVGHIFTKLGLQDRATTIVYASDRGIVAPETE